MLSTGYEHNVCLHQVLGLFTVVATVVGIVYFTDPRDVASSAGLDAAGVLLLILNIMFVLLMAALVLRAGKGSIRKYLNLAAALVKSKSVVLSKVPSNIRRSGPARSMSRARAVSLDRAASPSQDVALVTTPSSSYPAA